MLFVFIIHIVILAKCHTRTFPSVFLFPPRSVIQLHYLDVLLKSIMDSRGFPCFSSSFTEYSQCYSNIPTTLSCIGNEPSTPTPTTYPEALLRSSTSTHKPPDKHPGVVHKKKTPKDETSVVILYAKRRQSSSLSPPHYYRLFYR